MKEQAQILSDQTEHLLVGEVRTSGGGKSIQVTLNILAPTLNNFRVTIVAVNHDALIYPVRVFNMLDSDDGGSPCGDEETFRKKLSEILGSEKVHSVIRSLLSQAADEADSLAAIPTVAQIIGSQAADEAEPLGPR